MRKKNPFGMKRGMKPRMPVFQSPQRTTDYAVRGMVDMSKMAMFGVVTAGTIGMVGSLIKK